MHGHTIIADVKSISDIRFTLRSDSLYGALDRLTESGLVADHEEVVDGRLRRYYRLTDDGAAELTQAADRMRHNADAAAKRLCAGGRQAVVGFSHETLGGLA